MFAAICLAFVAAALGMILFGTGGAAAFFVGGLVLCGIDAVLHPERWA